jgi:signal peptidase II
MRRLAVIGAAIIMLDRISKVIVRGTMIYGESIKILDFFRITYVENTGAAWGLLNAGGYSNYLFLFFNLAATSYIVLNYGRFAVDKYSALAWSFVAAGAIGNLGDRIFVGAVIDFIDVRIFGYDFPVFNFADAALTAGGFLFAFSILRAAPLFRRVPSGR